MRQRDTRRRRLQALWLPNSLIPSQQRLNIINVVVSGSHCRCFTGGETRTFEFYKTSIETPGFRDFHERIQPFLLFYVDAASYIDVDDEKWAYYLL
jgi:hypothetical protein